MSAIYYAAWHSENITSNHLFIYLFVHMWKILAYLVILKVSVALYIVKKTKANYNRSKNIALKREYFLLGKFWVYKKKQ